MIDYNQSTYNTSWARRWTTDFKTRHVTVWNEMSDKILKIVQHFVEIDNTVFYSYYNHSTMLKYNIFLCVPCINKWMVDSLCLINLHVSSSKLLNNVDKICIWSLHQTLLITVNFVQIGPI
jgi:hypothetical protein